MARKSPKDLSLLKRGLIESCLGGKLPGKKGKARNDDDDDAGADPPPPKPKKPKGYADSVMSRR